VFSVEFKHTASPTIHGLTKALYIYSPEVSSLKKGYSSTNTVYVWYICTL